MGVLHIDFETRSTVDLKAAGLANYAADPTTDVWCMAWAINDQEPVVWTPNDPPTNFPHIDMFMHVKRGGIVYAHNAAFELAIWNEILVKRYGWPPLKPEQTRCTMAMAYAMALPGSLEKAAAAVGIAEQKDLAGGRLMLQMAKPREFKENDWTGEDCATCAGCGEDDEARACRACGGTGERYGKKIVWWDDPAKLEILYEYCRQDVRVERQLETRLMPLSDDEQALWELDQTINGRGVYVDRPTVTKAIAIVEYEQDRLNQEMRRVTGNFVGFCTETARLGAWVRSQGVHIAGVAKADVLDALAGDLPDAVRTALRLRQEAGKSSTAKLRSMLAAASADGRLRGMLQYHGAGTGRWAGRRVQLHNMPRPRFGHGEVEQAIDIIGRTPDPANAAKWLDMLHGSPLDVISSCLRGMLCAAPGHDLLAADFSAIEARVLAWLAGEESVLDVFRGHGKIYEHAAAGIYRKPMSAITKDERQVGKVAVLALGYGGGKGAFQAMAKGYGLVVGDEKAEEIKTAWREAHPRIVNYWYDLERAAMEAVLQAGTVTKAGPVRRGVQFRMKGSFLWCLLPSGRALCYPYPKIKPRETPWGALKDQLHYMTVDGTTNKWVETHTYGGAWAENVTQAVARDVLVHAIRACEAKFFPVVLHVHDEIVAEIPSSAKGCALEIFEETCASVPPWAEGLPLAATGWRGKRYRK